MKKDTNSVVLIKTEEIRAKLNFGEKFVNFRKECREV